MQTRRRIYIIIGIVLIAINLLTDLMELSELKHADDSNISGYPLGYFIGLHILLIFGIIFLRLAYKLNQKIKKKEEADLLENNIDSIGKDSQ